MQSKNGLDREKELQEIIQAIPWEQHFGSYMPAFIRKVPQDIYDEYFPLAEKRARIINKEKLYTMPTYQLQDEKWSPYKDLYWFGPGDGLLEPI